MSTHPAHAYRRPASERPDRPVCPTADRDQAPPSSRLSLLLCLALVTATFAAFGPTLSNGFINWDDPPNLLDNRFVRGCTPENLKWMFTRTHLGHYQPLTWLSFAIDYHLWGRISPRGIHLTSLILHALNAVCFYFLTLRLLRLATRFDGAHLQWGAWLAAMLFALHPLRVESVAWATERRDLVSGLFFILALAAYLRYGTPGRGPRRSWLILAVFLHACACFSKVICVTLLAVVVVLDFYPLGRLGGPGRWWGPAYTRVWSEKIPFLLVTLVASVIAPLAQGSSMLPLEYLGMGMRLAYTSLGLAFYFHKFFLPLNLLPIYEIRPGLSPLAWHFVAAAILLLLVTVVLVLVRRRFPAGLAVWFAYLAMLSPVTSLTQNGFQFAADRYTYLACLGWAVLLGAGLSFWLRKCPRRSGPLVVSAVVILAVLGMLGRLTWRQTRLWHDSIRLWTASLRVAPDSWVANRNLADALMEADRVRQAAEHYRRSLAVEQRNPSLHANAAIAFAKLDQLDQADHHARQALQMNPRGPDSLLNAAFVKRQLRQWDAAIELYRRGARWYPDDVRFHANLAPILALRGDHLAAVKSFRRAIALTPDALRLYRLMGESLLELGRYAEAERTARRALEINPDFKPAGKLLARIQARASQAAAEQRVRECRRLLAERPGDAAARLNLAEALAAAGRWAQAADEYSDVLLLQPTSVEARIGWARMLVLTRRESQAVTVLRQGLAPGRENPRLILALARQLATSADPEVRHGPEAVRLAEGLLQATEQPSASMLGVLAAAYAEAGRFEDAVRACRRAVEKARRTGPQAMLQRQLERLELYRAGKPFHQPVTEREKPPEQEHKREQGN